MFSFLFFYLQIFTNFNFDFSFVFTFYFFYWSSICQHIATYSITPRAHPAKCPPQCPSPSHPNPPPTSPSTTPYSFPRLGDSHVLSPSLIFSLIFSPFPFIPFHYFLYSPNEWDHITFVLLRLTYFTSAFNSTYSVARDAPTPIWAGMWTGLKGKDK